MPKLLTKNPLRKDPSRTTLIRRLWQSEMKRRFRSLSRALISYFARDHLGLRTGDMEPHADKLARFAAWLQAETERTIYGGSVKTWMGPYVQAAYLRGTNNALGMVPKPEVEPSPLETFLRLRKPAGVPPIVTIANARTLRRPTRADKVAALTSRPLESLKGVSARMTSRLNQILSSGMIEGSSARAIAREMTERVGIEREQALRIVRTETVFAQAEAQLDTFEDLGIDEVGVLAEWTTAGDERVCADCAAMEGKTFTVDEARGMIPLHPNCRCAWTPSEVKTPRRRRSRR